MPLFYIITEHEGKTVMTANVPKIKTNLDTGFLKLIAILSMVADHVGSAFFPQYPVFRWPL